MNRIYLILIFTISMISIHLNAQNPDSIETFYYSEDWEITSKDYASYYRVGTFDMKNHCFVGEVRDYDLQNNLKMIGNYSFERRHGTFRYYNYGSLDSLKAEFEYGKRTGEWQEFSNKGETYKNCRYLEDFEKILEYSNGKPEESVQNGYGHITNERTYGPDSMPYSIEGEIKDGLRVGKWVVKNGKDQIILTEYYNNGILKKGNPNLKNNEFGMAFFVQDFYLIELPQSMSITESFAVMSGVRIPSNSILKALYKHTTDNRGISERTNDIEDYTGLEPFLDEKILFSNVETMEFQEDDSVVVSFVHNIDFSIDDVQLLKPSFSEALDVEILNVFKSIDRIILKDRLNKPVRIKYIYKLKTPFSTSPAFDL